LVDLLSEKQQKAQATRGSDMRRSRRGLPTDIVAALTVVCFITTITTQPQPAAAQSGKHKESPALAEQSKDG
jgi:hypothetical protein